MLMKNRNLFILALISLFISFQGLAADKEQKMNAYDFSFTTLIGHKPLPLSDFKGKVLLVVNTASHCGLTPQYAGLEKLYEEYKEKGLVVLGVPANDFGQQEPGTSDDISNFCRVNYGVTFPITSKVSVIGAQADPFYQWAAKTLGEDNIPQWNFHKYLINRKGELVASFGSKVTPDSDEIKTAILKALDE